MNIQKSSFPEIRKNLLAWFAQNKRPLPWRSGYSPYATWIAEVMMQQTQMDRGLVFFDRWMKRFPTVVDVAAADETDLLAAWEGLGYYRRVRMLQAAARIIIERHGGIFPNTYEAILALPGIGAYTAGAIASTAFNIAVPCIDGNAERVIARLFNIDTPVRTEPAKSFIHSLATDLIPEGSARDFNQSLMELGSLVCAKSPRCGICPLSRICLAYALNRTDKLPVTAPTKSLTRLNTVCGVLIQNNRILLRRRSHDGAIWAGLMMFPDTEIKNGESPEKALRRAWNVFGLNIAHTEKITVIRHKYTVYDITLHALRAETEDTSRIKANDLEWIPAEQIKTVPLPAPHRKIAHKLNPQKASGNISEAPVLCL